MAFYTVASYHVRQSKIVNTHKTLGGRSTRKEVQQAREIVRDGGTSIFARGKHNILQDSGFNF
jgi:hypothetical protein